MMTYRWIAEPRVVPVLRRLLGRGDEFEAEPRIGKALVAQGLAEAVFTLTAQEARTIIASLPLDIPDDDQWSDDEP